MNPINRDLAIETFPFATCWSHCVFSDCHLLVFAHDFPSVFLTLVRRFEIRRLAINRFIIKVPPPIWIPTTQFHPPPNRPKEPLLELHSNFQSSQSIFHFRTYAFGIRVNVWLGLLSLIFSSPFSLDCCGSTTKRKQCIRTLGMNYKSNQRRSLAHQLSLCRQTSNCHKQIRSFFP